MLFSMLSLIAVGVAAAGGPASADSSAASESSPAYRRAAAARKPEDPKLVWTPASVALVARKLAPGVFAVHADDAAGKNAEGVPVATSGGFVIGTKGVLLIDTMINRNLAGQLLALVREQTKRPILYAVNTSYHGDHSYGNQFLPRATRVIQHAKTQAYIQQSFAKDVAFMSQYFGSNSGLQELTAQKAAILLGDGESREIDLGGKRVTVAHLGFAQTEGDLFVSVADDKVLFTGNPIISSGPSLPWLLDGHYQESLATLRKLRTNFPADTVVVPGHGAPTGMAALDDHIRYLEELGQEVRAALKDGLDANKTSERVGGRMQARYGKYRIYPWVHGQLNVAKTYQELSGR
jgi:cyclase